MTKPEWQADPCALHMLCTLLRLHECIYHLTTVQNVETAGRCWSCRACAACTCAGICSLSCEKPRSISKQLHEAYWLDVGQQSCGSCGLPHCTSAQPCGLGRTDKNTCEFVVLLPLSKWAFGDGRSAFVLFITHTLKAAEKPGSCIDRFLMPRLCDVQLARRCAVRRQRRWAMEAAARLEAAEAAAEQSALAKASASGRGSSKCSPVTPVQHT